MTLEDDLAAELKEMAFKSGRSFKEVVNSVLRAGLNRGDQSPRPAYRLSSVCMGSVQGHLNLNKALQIAAILEDEEIQRKLELRK